MTLDTQRMSRSERAASLYIRDQIVKPRSKRGNLVDPEFRGAGLEIQTLTDKYVGISGVARSGKSLAILWRLNQLALQYPGMRGLIIRKTRESLNESALVTFERDVLGEGNPIIPNGQRNSRHSYRYPNGSEIIVRGLLASGKDAKAQVMSSEYDVIYVQESTEISEFEYSQLCTRLSNFRVPQQSIWLDCNPDAPSHWIWRHHLAGKLKLLHSYLTDNPKWWKIDPSHKDGGYWTEHGQSVFATLSNLTGVQRERLFEGRWTQATGLVYGDDTWNDGAVDGNVTEKADYIPELEPNPITGELVDAATVYYGCDDGYAGEIDPLTEEFTPESHPRAILLCQMRADGTICVFDESYKVKTQAERQIKEVEQMGYGEGDSFRRYAEPFRVVVDKSAVDLIGRFNEKYNATNQKIVNVEEGIKYLRSYLGKDENEVRKVLVHPRCKHLRYEMSSYKRDDKGNVMKEYDHGCDALRYLVSVIGSIPRPNFRVLG